MNNATNEQNNNPVIVQNEKEDVALYPKVLNEEEKQMLLAKYRGDWDIGKLPVVESELYNPFAGNASISFFNDDDAPFVPVRELGQEYPTPDFGDGLLSTMDGLYYKANKVIQTSESEYLFEDLELTWPDKYYNDRNGKDWMITSLIIHDDNPSDNIMNISVTYNQNSSIKDYLQKGIRCGRYIGRDDRNENVNTLNISKDYYLGTWKEDEYGNVITIESTDDPKVFHVIHIWEVEYSDNQKKTIEDTMICTLLEPGDEGYDQARTGKNGKGIGILYYKETIRVENGVTTIITLEDSMAEEYYGYLDQNELCYSGPIRDQVYKRVQ